MGQCFSAVAIFFATGIANGRQTAIGVTVKVQKIYQVGHCLHPKATTWPGQGFRNHLYPSTAVLIEHSSRGLILFDTGYAPHFFTATRHWPERAYALLTPVTLAPGFDLASQLRRDGVGIADIGTIVVSHFHADHVAGLRDFPNAEIVYLAEGLQNLNSRSRLGQLHAGFLKSLLPEDFSMRARGISEKQFVTSQDFFNSDLQFTDLFPNDPGIRLVSLPGHAPGHMGLFIEAEPRPFFFLADTSWHIEALRNRVLPSRIAQSVFADREAYRKTFFLLSDLLRREPNVHWLACHCAEGFEDLKIAPTPG